MKKASALLSVRLWIDCPYCKEQMDILDYGYLNDEGKQWNTIGSWGIDDRWKNINEEVECEKCKQTFIWDEIRY